MAQVAILVNGPSDPRKTEISSALAILLGCPLLHPSRVQEALIQQTGPVAPRARIRALSIDTIWRTSSLIEAGVVIDASWEAADLEAARAGLEGAGSPRLVEVWCGPSGEPLGLGPVVEVDDATAVDMDALVQRISALFV
jgi:hypothetical protein